MPLHEDDPNRDGNLSDDDYRAAFERIRDEAGDDGLHIVPGLSERKS